MVFWSSFSKKIKQAVSQIAFDLLKKRVDKIETNYVDKTTNNTFRSTEKFQTISMQNKANKDVLRFVVNTDYSYSTIDGGSGSGIYIKNLKDPTNPDNATNKGYVDGLFNPLNTKVDSVIRGLQNGNIVNYRGEYTNSTTYNLAEAVTLNGEWFVSNQDNNLNHTPSKTSSTYWIYISAPTVDLTPYLTKNEASSTYATINTTNGINTRLTTAEQTLSTNSTNIVNLNNTKANKNYVDNNFYNKTKINSFNLKTLTGSITNISVPPQNLGVGNYRIIKMAFDTDININPVNWNEFAVIDFYFVNAVRNKTWLKPTFVSLVGNSKLGIEFFTPDVNSYVNQVGARVAIRIIKNENYIG